MKVLFVQKEPLLTTALKLTLLKQGYDVIFCKTATSAIEHINDAEPALIIADIMRSANKAEVIALARSKNIPVIILSNSQSEDQLQQAFDLDVADYAMLPLSLPELSLRINKLTRLRAIA